MRQLDWERLGTEVRDLARLAGQLVLLIYEKDGVVSVSLKSDQSPLTEADLASHNCICAGLTKLTPKIPVVSEEDASSLFYRKSSGLFWLIDPLDGTKEFVARNGEFTVNIALIQDGQPVWGVVYAPVLGLMYWGGRDFGAFREAKGHVEKLKVSMALCRESICRVVASKSHLNAETEAFIDQLGDVSLIQAGSSLKFCKVAEGAADVYPRLAPTCEWDTAAAQAVVEGAGGFVVDLSGNRLVYGKEEVLNPSFFVASIPLKAFLDHD